ncbi:hypothetical protein LSH36_480g01049 [Paralvinella palmiformis]|uniref:Uncharacterized protein n=1 Tax=Paralvinella palmiformis TaxID=53620 RepID=A0AAD9J989_9ANNE|nr:hypothetical protein LSH36_480g01049 [Paralvinella palmiformis]
MGVVRLGRGYAIFCASIAICYCFYYYDVIKNGALRQQYHVIRDIGPVPDGQGARCIGYVDKVSQIKTDREGSCQVLKFIKNLNKEKGRDQCYLDFAQLSNCKHVFYNAVPKSASRLLRDLFAVLASRYNYTNFDGVDNTTMNPFRKGPDAVKEYMEKCQRDIPNYKRRHLFFLDFVRDVKTPLVMINVIREPIDHVLSIYNWLAFGDTVRNRTKGSKQLGRIWHGSRGREMKRNIPRTPVTRFDPNPDMESIGDCLKKYGDAGICIKWRLLPLPFFYGNEVHPDPAVLQVAKQHVEDTYLLVGLTEDIPSFLEMLELLLPHLFCNSTAIYYEIESEAKQIYKTSFKREISEGTRRLLKNYLRYHIDFYQFVKQRFYNIVDKVKGQISCNYQKSDYYIDSSDMHHHHHSSSNNNNKNNNI